MGWELTIDGDVETLRWLVRTTSTATLRIKATGASHRLEWDGLEAVDDVREVTAAALRHLGHLSGLGSVLLRREAALRLVDTSFRRADGGRDVYVTIHDAVRFGATLTGQLSVMGPDGVPKAAEEQNPLPRLLSLAETDEDVAKVLRLAGGDLSDWSALFRLYEVVAAAAGGPDALAELTGASKAQLSIFAKSANSPALSGDAARHGVQRGSLPRRGMSLSDAKRIDCRHQPRLAVYASRRRVRSRMRVGASCRPRR